jgi:hypothetical protein
MAVNTTAEITTNKKRLKNLEKEQGTQGIIYLKGKEYEEDQ